MTPLTIHSGDVATIFLIVGVAHLLGQSVGVPSVEAGGHGVHDEGAESEVVIAGTDEGDTSEDMLRVVGSGHRSVEEVAIGQAGVDVGIAVGPVLSGEVAVVGRSNGDRHPLVRLIHLDMVIELVDRVAVVVGQLDDVAAGSGGLGPLLLVVVAAQQWCAIVAHQHLGDVVGDTVGVLAVGQLAVCQRAGGVGQGDGTCGKGCTLGRTSDIGLVALVVAQFLGSLNHL